MQQAHLNTHLHCLGQQVDFCEVVVRLSSGFVGPEIPCRKVSSFATVCVSGAFKHLHTLRTYRGDYGDDDDMLMTIAC